MNIPLNRIVVTLSVIGLALFCGCGESGPKFVRVTGKVLFEKDDSPAEFGTIEFRSESKPPVIATSPIASDGSFELKAGTRDGTTPGIHRVLVKQVIGGFRKTGIRHNHGHEVAPKYSSYRTSPLKEEVFDEETVYLEVRVDAKED